MFGSSFNIILLLLFTVKPDASLQKEDFSAAAMLSPQEGEIGDLFTYRLEIKKPPDWDLRLPETFNFGTFELLSKEHETETLDGKEIEKYIFSISAYETGEIEIPSFEIKGIDPEGKVHTHKTDSFKVKIASLLPPDAGIGNMKDIAPPRQAMVPFYLPLYIALALLAAALMAVGVRYLVKRKTKIAGEGKPLTEPPLPAHHIALKKLRILTGEGLLEKGLFKEYYYRISEIIREYFELRYRFNALEMTTQELIRKLRELHPPRLALDLCTDFLHLCDMVKFAKYVPQDREKELVYKNAHFIIESTRERAEEELKTRRAA